VAGTDAAGGCWRWRWRWCWCWCWHRPGGCFCGARQQSPRRCVAGGAKLKRSAASSSPLQLAGGRRRSSITHYPSHPHARSPRHDRLHTLHPPDQSLPENHRRPAVSVSAMDSLVAQYSRPVDADEGQTEQQQLELYSGAPDLSLKFALPPVAQVRLSLPLAYGHTG
jgi:hypothetical protein